MKLSGHEQYLVTVGEKLHHLFDEAHKGHELPEGLIPKNGVTKMSEVDGVEKEVAIVTRIETFELNYGPEEFTMKIGTLFFDTIEMTEMFSYNNGYGNFLDFYSEITKHSPERGRITKKLAWFVNDRYDYHDPE